MMNGDKRAGSGGGTRRANFNKHERADSSGFGKQRNRASAESELEVDSVQQKGVVNGTQDEVSSAASDTDRSESRNSDESTDSTDCSDDDIDAVAFIKQYTALTRAAKRLGTDLDIAEDFEGGSIMVIDNVEDGEKLATRIGYDPSKAITAFTHTLAITETANRNVKKCGNTSSQFSIEKYLDIIINLSVDEEGDYSSKKAHEILDQDARCYSEGYSLTSLQGIVEFSKDIKVVVKVRKQNTKLSKTAFDETIPPTQHEIVNSQVLKGQVGSENDSISKSRRQAEELELLCNEYTKPAIGVLEYGLRNAHNAQTFIKQVFDAAVITRDGYAALCDPAAISLEKSDQQCQQLLLKAAKPPDITEGDFDVNRSQYILRMNSKSIQALLKSTNMVFQHNGKTVSK